ncbi:hypothetical protein NIES4075_38810 [Tolypothrix sp. NIES-4075]|nr:hypothetical protein NIES4075_38810 [Tolypothrix sp. NIES-4075]
MSTRFLLDEDDIKELTKLMLVMIETQESRKQICRDLGIDPHEVSFIIGTSDDTFCTELIDCLNRFGYQEYLCKLCCDKLFPILNKSVYSHRISILKKIVEKLNCNCNQEKQNHPIPTVPNPDESKSESLFTKIGNVNKKLLAGGAILLIVLAGYPTYEHFKQPSQLDQDQVLAQKAPLVQSEIEGNIGAHRKGGVLVKLITKVELRNFIVEAQFDNPYDGTIMDNWIYGFAFKENTSDDLNDSKRKGLDAWVDSKKKTWGFSSHNISLNGNLSNLNLSDKSSNKLRLTVNNKKAKFFVNDMYIETFDVSDLTNKGSIFFTAAGGISGKSVQYQYKNLRVWSLDN